MGSTLAIEDMSRSEKHRKLLFRNGESKLVCKNCVSNFENKSNTLLKNRSYSFTTNKSIQKNHLRASYSNREVVILQKQDMGCFAGLIYFCDFSIAWCLGEYDGGETRKSD